MPEPQTITASGLCLEIEGREILGDLCFSVETARLAVLGRNGSGKSSLARLLAGLLPPSAGRLSIAGIDPARERAAALERIGILFQNPDRQIIFPTVIEELAFGLSQQGHKAPQARARDWLARFGRAHWENAHCATLSQGQKHLLCLMAVLAMEPRLIILDEPFAGLDIPTRAQLHRHLARYEGALIHISHDPRDLEGYEYALWLDEGRLREQGPAYALLPEYVAAMEQIGARDDIADLPG